MIYDRCDETMYGQYNPSTPSFLQTPTYIEPPQSARIPDNTHGNNIHGYNVVQTTHEEQQRCFNPYNNETMEDIKNDLINMGTLTERELDGENGIIDRIRRVSFYDAERQEYGIMTGISNDNISTNIYNKRIYYLQGDNVYCIDGSKTYKTDKSNFNSDTYEVKNMNEIERKDIIVDDTIEKVWFSIEHEWDEIIRNRISKNSIVECGTKYSNYIGNVTLFGVEFNISRWVNSRISCDISRWSIGVISSHDRYLSDQGFDKFANNNTITLYSDVNCGEFVKHFINYNTYNLLNYWYEMFEKRDQKLLENTSSNESIDNYYQDIIDTYNKQKQEIYKKLGINGKKDIEIRKAILNKLEEEYSKIKLPTNINVKCTKLTLHYSIPKVYENMPLTFKDKKKRWKGASKKTNSLYGLIEKIHKEGVYHGTISDSENRSNVIYKDGKHYLNSYNWTNSPPKSDTIEEKHQDNILEDTEKLINDVRTLLRNYYEKHKSHPQINYYYSYARNGI